MKRSILLPVILTLLTGGCQSQGTPEPNAPVEIQQSSVNLPQLAPMETGETVAILTTNKGVIKMRFFEEYAPKAVENFITHAQNGYYNGVIFHRVINDFMIQGGDPTGTGSGGESIYDKEFENEVSPDLRHFRGAVSMANRGPDTNGSQFFIVQGGPIEDALNTLSETQNEPFTTSPDGTKVLVKDIYPPYIINKYLELGGAHFLDLGYSVFGYVYEGMDIVDEIANSETDSNDKPLSDIIIENIEITTY